MRRLADVDQTLGCSIYCHCAFHRRISTTAFRRKILRSSSCQQTLQVTSQLDWTSCNIVKQIESADVAKSRSKLRSTTESRNRKANRERWWSRDIAKRIEGTDGVAKSTKSRREFRAPSSRKIAKQTEGAAGVVKSRSKLRGPMES